MLIYTLNLNTFLITSSFYYIGCKFNTPCRSYTLASPNPLAEEDILSSF